MIELRDAGVVLSGLSTHVTGLEGLYNADRPIDATLQEWVTTIKTELESFEPQFEELGRILADLRTMVRLLMTGL
jgi:hypothetical protein